jgi:predicted dehydrogenase
MRPSPSRPCERASVFVEKPFTLTVDDAELVVSEAGRRG